MSDGLLAVDVRAVTASTPAKSMPFPELISPWHSESR